MTSSYFAAQTKGRAGWSIDVDQPEVLRFAGNKPVAWNPAAVS
jgi:hypothetical protein